jgi:hypothetical protein
MAKPSKDFNCGKLKWLKTGYILGKNEGNFGLKIPALCS